MVSAGCVGVVEDREAGRRRPDDRAASTVRSCWWVERFLASRSPHASSGSPRGVAFAETVSVEDPSPDRRQPAADPACGGNVYAHIDYSRQLAIKGEIIADGLARIGRMELPAPVVVTGSRDDGYRMRARLHVQQGRDRLLPRGQPAIVRSAADAAVAGSTCDVLEAVGDAVRAPATRLDPRNRARGKPRRVSAGGPSRRGRADSPRRSAVAGPNRRTDRR